MHHIGTVAIETKRLLLRRFTEVDATPAFRNWTSDEKVTEFLRWPTHQSVEITERVLKEWVAGYARDDFYQWAIVLKEQGDEPLGTISVVGQNETLHSMHIGYCIGSKWWGQGITSEAFAAIIPVLFDEVKVNRIESQHDPRNPGSGKVMTKCGLRYEGTLREADFSNCGIVDAAMYSLLAREYRAAIKMQAE
ncbi:MAG: GNAT family N-acetyltransferase [Clostridium sp. SCN 57-10]|nr:MAG: GNAT family N-acetyltransferase [Clostridium sp. SCN 57-10]